VGLARFLSALLLTSALAAGAPRAVWIWEPETLRLIDDPAYERRVVDLLKAHGFGTLYLYADAYRDRNPVLGDRAGTRALLARLHARGFRVEALLGSYPLRTSEYVLPERDGAARAMMRHLLDYNRAVEPAERFDGAHLDIEPYTLDAWTDATRADICRLFLDRSREWVTMAREAGRGFRVSAAIPFWYDRFEVAWEGAARPMNAHVQDLYDYVVLMDYRNEAEGDDGIIAHAMGEVAYAAGRGKRVVVGLETGDTEPAKLTFRHRGPAVLAREMGKVEAAFARQPAFAGFALHHLGTWMELLAQPPAPPAREP
jgi:hypothetical protein